MKKREMKLLTEHFDKYLEGNDCTVMHSPVENGLHVDVLIYKPNEKYPFWKLVTMGASDYKMPEIPRMISRYNEYMMFVDANVDLNNKKIASWYYNKLLTIAGFAYYNRTAVSYLHSLEWAGADPSDESRGAFILFPEFIESTGVLRCKLGFRKMVACFQAILLNEETLELLKQIGPSNFSEYIYSHDEEVEDHFLPEQHGIDM